MSGEAELRILSGIGPCEGAREEKMNLEDVFLHYFGEKADEAIYQIYKKLN